MNLKKYLEKHLRGWLPKEPSLPSNKVKMSEVKTKVTKPHWWEPLWMALVAIAIVFVVINYFLFHYPLSSARALKSVSSVGEKVFFVLS